MSNAVVEIRNEYSGKQIDLIRRTVAADCNQTEFDLFFEVARRVGLDPFRKQIYAIVYSKDSADKRKMSIITGIDGFRSVADRSGKYRPDENEPQIFYSEDLKDPVTNPLGIERAVVTVHKFGPDGQWYPLKGVAYWSEFAPVKEVWAYDEKLKKRQPTGALELPEGNWRKMPRVMIVKCAEAQAIRKGWPEDLSGIYAPEEMERASVDATASELAEAAATEDRLKLIGGKDAIMCMWAPGKPLEAVPIGEFADRCIEFIHSAPDAQTIKAWSETNRASLRDFWARSKSDALGVNAFMEKRVQELAGG